MAGYFGFKNGRILAAVFILAACASAKPAAHSPWQFPLSPGDKIHLTVYEEPTMTGDYTVDENGMVIIPLIGGIPAGGRTKYNLQDQVAETLRKGELYKAPHVTVDVASMRPFYILGEVNKPGAYPYQPALDVFSAVALAGGYTPRAAQGGIVIRRGAEGARKRFNADQDTPIFPGDSITVKQRFF